MTCYLSLLAKMEGERSSSTTRRRAAVFVRRSRILSSSLLEALALPETRKRPDLRRRGRASFFRAGYKPTKQSHRGPSFARCSYCGIDVSVSHGGKNDVEKHLKTSTVHASAVRSRKGAQSKPWCASRNSPIFLRFFLFHSWSEGAKITPKATKMHI